MKNIWLKQLTIKHFKGIKNLTIDFKDVTNILAANGLGKTSIFDAFLWLFFGKNSAGKSEFQFRPVNENNDEIPKLETEVEAIFLVNDLEYSAKKVHRQKWETPTGGTEPVRKGNENTFFFNGVPVIQRDYDAKIAGIIDETLFKLLTNVMHFNTLPWLTRRAMLTSMVGDLHNDEVISEMSDLSPEQKAFLVQILNQHKKLEDYVKKIDLQKKTIKEELERIPVQIAEVRRGKLGEGIDFNATRKLIKIKENELANIDDQLADKSKSLEKIHEEITTLQGQVFDLKNKNQSRVQTIKNDVQNKTLQLRSDLSGLHSEISLLKDKQNRITRNKSSAQSEKTGIELKMSSIRDLWREKNGKVFVFDETTGICYACKQALPADNIGRMKEEMEAEFNKEKTDSLAQLNQRGLSLKSQAEQLGNDITGYDQQLTEVAAEIESKEASYKLKSEELAQLNERTESEANEKLATDETIVSNQEKIVEIEGQISKLRNPTADSSAEDLKAKKRTLSSDLDGLKKDLAKEEGLKAADLRITELSDQERDLSQQKATLEKSEYLIDSFSKAKMDMLVGKINRQFELVSFKMFKTLQNGCIEETCETLINGVPFDSANTAAKVNGGIDIINNMGRIYMTRCPIFIDNRESVSDLIHSDSQLINLVVSTEHKSINIS